MKIIIKDSVASASWSFRKGDLIDTEDNEFITQDQALIWLNSGIAEAVKESASRRRKKEQS
ncbi:hypothetical protein [Rubinisphaera brasiliensis]|uniref:hypothetical protein n=1 Tax=Rubinisphaera brasiliensis TaxID=119 RepID=UPI000312323B|nr:hypothetical protein [Rubinisphaera brasiliensis]